MQTCGAEERFLVKNHRARLRDQLAAWNEVTASTELFEGNRIARLEVDDRGWSRNRSGIQVGELSRALWHMATGFLILGLSLLMIQWLLRS